MSIQQRIYRISGCVLLFIIGWYMVAFENMRDSNGSCPHEYITDYCDDDYNLFARLWIYVFHSLRGAPAASYDTADSLCVAFDGRPYGTANGKTLLMNCKFILYIVGAFREEVTISPLRQLATQLRRGASMPFKDQLTDPNNVNLAHSCSIDRLQEKPQYLCKSNDTLARIFLRDDGSVQRAEVALPASASPLQATLTLRTKVDRIDILADEGVAFLMQALVMRFRQIGDPDVDYRTDGRTLFGTISNSQISQPGAIRPPVLPSRTEGVMKPEVVPKIEKLPEVGFRIRGIRVP